MVMRQTRRAAAGIQTLSGSVSSFCVWLGPVTTPDREPSVGESVSLFREPDAGNLPVRFDEREQETEPSQTGLRWRGKATSNIHRETTVTAPVLDSTRDYTQNPPVPEVSDTWGLAKVCPQVEFKLLQEEKGLANEGRVVCI